MNHLAVLQDAGPNEKKDAEKIDEDLKSKSNSAKPPKDKVVCWKFQT